MNQKGLSITLFTIFIIAILGYFVLMENQTVIAQTQEVVFVSKEECEQKSGKLCTFQMCDYIPSGKTFEEVCGKDFKKGWVPSQTNIGPGETLVTGHLIYISDVMTIPDHPITKGSIILIPSDRFTSFLKEIPIQSDFNESMLWHLQSGASKEVASKYITANSPLDSKGRFSMAVSQGNYVLCFSNPEEQLKSQWPIKILGCVRIEAQEGRKLYLDLGSVEGGLRIDRQKSE